MLLPALSSTLLLALSAAERPADDVEPPTPAPAATAAEDAGATRSAEVLRPTTLFEKGRLAFGRAQYQDAIAILRPLLYPDSRLETEGEVVQAHRMLGVAHVFEKQLTEARHEFRKLLELRPDYRFDPLLDPAPVVEIFEGVLRERQSDLQALQALRDRELEAQRARERECTVERRSVERSRFIAVLPFGTGQFHNGQARKGWLFLGVEAALAATSVGALVTNFAMFGVRPRRGCLAEARPDSACPPESIDYSDENLSRTLLRVQLISGGLFFAAAVWGAIDALRNFQPLVPLGTSSPGREPQRAGLRLAPFLNGNVVGPGLTLTY